MSNVHIFYDAALGLVFFYTMARLALYVLGRLWLGLRLWWAGLYSVQVAERMERYC